MKRVILITIISLIYSISYGQKKVRLVGLNSDNMVFEKITTIVEIPDFNSPIQSIGYNNYIMDTIKYSKELKKNKQIVADLSKMIKGLFDIKNGKLEKKEKRKTLREAYSLVSSLKNKVHSKFKYVNFSAGFLSFEYDYKDLSKRAKEEKIKYDYYIKNNIEMISRILADAPSKITKEDIENLPKIKKELEMFSKISDFTKIKGNYIFKGYVYVTKEHDYSKKLVQGQIDPNQKYGVYDFYNEKNIKNCYMVAWYKNTDGGVDVYKPYSELNHTHVIDDEYMAILEEGAKHLGAKIEITQLDPNLILKNGTKIAVNKYVFNSLRNKDYNFIAKRKNTIKSVKQYLRAAQPLLKKMYNGILAHKNWTLTTTKRTSFVNATKKVKSIDKKIRALYGNNSDKYIEFQGLLDTETIEDMIYFDTVLTKSKYILGLQ